MTKKLLLTIAMLAIIAAGYFYYINYKEDINYQEDIYYQEDKNPIGCKYDIYSQTDQEIANYLNSEGEKKIAKDQDLLRAVSDYYNCKISFGPNEKIYDEAKKYFNEISINDKAKNKYHSLLSESYNSKTIKNDEGIWEKSYNGEKYSDVHILFFETVFSELDYLASEEYIIFCNEYADKITSKYPDPTGEVTVENDTLCERLHDIVKSSLEDEEYFKNMLEMKALREDENGNKVWVDRLNEKSSSKNSPKGFDLLKMWRWRIRIGIAYRVGEEEAAMKFCNNFAGDEFASCEKLVQGQTLLYKSYKNCNCSLKPFYDPLQ